MVDTSKVFLTVMIEPALKQKIEEYGKRPNVQRSMSWLTREWIKEGLARATGGGE